MDLTIVDLRELSRRLTQTNIFSWLQSGNQGEMTWLERDPGKTSRSDPGSVRGQNRSGIGRELFSRPQSPPN